MTFFQIRRFFTTNSIERPGGEICGIISEHLKILELLFENRLACKLEACSGGQNFPETIPLIIVKSGKTKVG
jgi:hypothetical protein